MCGLGFFLCVYICRQLPLRRADEEYNQYEEDLLASFCLPIVEFQRNKIFTDDHPGDSFRVILVVTKKSSVLGELYASYRKTKTVS